MEVAKNIKGENGIEILYWMLQFERLNPLHRKNLVLLGFGRPMSY